MQDMLMCSKHRGPLKDSTRNHRVARHELAVVRTSFKRAGEDIFDSVTNPYAESGSGNGGDVRLPEWDRSSQVPVRLQHTPGRHGRQALQIVEEIRKGKDKPTSHTFLNSLKACRSLQDLESARWIHAEVVRSGFESDVYVGNLLVDVYVKCGSLSDARCLFEIMPHRDVVSWNAMIFGYVQTGDGEQALQLYSRMQQEGVVPNDRTIVCALKACKNLAGLDGKHRCVERVNNPYLEQVKAIHLHAVISGFEVDVYVGNTLVDAYSKCGSLVDARKVFDKMRLRNVVSWNAMIMGYAQSEEGEKALKLYKQIQQGIVVPNERTFVAALKACSSLAALKEGNVGYGRSEKSQIVEQVRGIHADIVESKFVSDIFVWNMLVDAYSKCGSLVDAMLVFEKMPRRDVVSWNAIIMGHALMEEGARALQLYARMQQQGVVPNSRTFIGALKACSSLAQLEEGNGTDQRCSKQQCLERVRVIHSHIVKHRAESAVFVATMLVDVYIKCGSLLDARRTFEKMPCRDVVSWTAMILGYAQMDKGELALQLYTQMQREGIEPDGRAFVGALKACSSLAAKEEGTKLDGVTVKIRCLEQVRAIQLDVQKSEFKFDLFVGNMLVDALAKCRSLVEARSIFEGMPYRDVVSWNTMILGYAQMGEAGEALQLYTCMQQEDVMPDLRTFVGALMACGILAQLEKGKDIHGQILRNGLQATDSFVASSLIDMYGKCGSMVDAQQVFDAVPTRDVVTWSALIAGYARQGNSELVFHFFERMKQGGIQPEVVTFLSVLTVCCHVGLVDKGQHYFEAMSRDFSVTPTIEHYTCMVDLLGRAGQVEEAMAMVRMMPVPPDSVAWRTIMGACQKWKNISRGTVVKR